MPIPHTLIRTTALHQPMTVTERATARRCNVMLLHPISDWTHRACETGHPCCRCRDRSQQPCCGRPHRRCPACGRQHFPAAFAGVCGDARRRVPAAAVARRYIATHLQPASIRRPRAGRRRRAVLDRANPRTATAAHPAESACDPIGRDARCRRHGTAAGTRTRRQRRCASRSCGTVRRSNCVRRSPPVAVPGQCHRHERGDRPRAVTGRSGERRTLRCECDATGAATDDTRQGSA